VLSIDPEAIRSEARRWRRSEFRGLTNSAPRNVAA
jgi:hypothetical protein